MKTGTILLGQSGIFLRFADEEMSVHIVQQIRKARVVDRENLRLVLQQMSKEPHQKLRKSQSRMSTFLKIF